jgi:hypothetical protein
MTTIVNLTHAELRKLIASRTFLIGLALSVGLAVISVALDAVVAGKNGQPSCTSRSGTPASSAAVMKACRKVCGPPGLVIPARCAARRTIRAAP